METVKLKHGTVRDYWNGCHCFRCRVAIAEYRRNRYRIRNGGLTTVTADKSRQLLLQFETVTEAAKATALSKSICSRIRNGRVKTIRISTEQKILRAA